MLPPRKGSRGRKPSKRVTELTPIRVDAWADEQPQEAWRRVELRHATRGKLTVEVLHREVWLWDGKEAQARQWRLIIRRECANHEERKYSLSNAPDSVCIRRLARMQGQRYWIERGFQDGKSEVGMTHYQARGWKSWQHHMTLVMMAMLFLLKERLLNEKDHPLLSCADIVRLLCGFLPARDRGAEELIRQLETRHRKRAASIEFFTEKQRLEDIGAVGSM